MCVNFLKGPSLVIRRYGTAYLSPSVVFAKKGNAFFQRRAKCAEKAIKYMLLGYAHDKACPLAMLNKDVLLYILKMVFETKYDSIWD